MTRPIASARETDRPRAAALGCQPISSAMARIRSRVRADTPGRSLRAKETAPRETPAASAMSLMVGRRFTTAFSRKGGGSTSLGGSGGEAVVDEALQEQEEQQRRHDDEDRAGRDGLPVGAERALEAEERRRDRAHALRRHVQERDVEVVVDEDALDD